jgi:hypothetical protein
MNHCSDSLGQTDTLWYIDPQFTVRFSMQANKNCMHGDVHRHTEGVRTEDVCCWGCVYLRGWRNQISRLPCMLPWMWHLGWTSMIGWVVQNYWQWKLPWMAACFPGCRSTGHESDCVIADGSEKSRWSKRTHQKLLPMGCNWCTQCTLNCTPWVLPCPLQMRWQVFW